MLPKRVCKQLRRLAAFIGSVTELVRRDSGAHPRWSQEKECAKPFRDFRLGGSAVQTVGGRASSGLFQFL